MVDKKPNPRVFKMWTCPTCAHVFNAWAQPSDEKRSYLICPNCYNHVPVSRKKNDLIYLLNETEILN